MKKHFFGVLLLVVLTVLCGCGGGTKKKGKTKDVSDKI